MSANPHSLSMMANTAAQMNRAVLEDEIRLRQVYEGLFAAERAKGTSIERADKLVRVDEAYLAQERQLADRRQQRDGLLAHVSIMKRTLGEGGSYQDAVVRLVAPHWWTVLPAMRENLVREAMALVETIDATAHQRTEERDALADAKLVAEMAAEGETDGA